MKAADDTEHPAVACNPFGVLHNITDPGVGAARHNVYPLKRGIDQRGIIEQKIGFAFTVFCRGRPNGLSRLKVCKLRNFA